MSIFSKVTWDARNRFRIIVGAAVTLLLTYLAYRQFDPAALRERIGAIPFFPLLVCIGGQIFLQIAHFIRWGILMRRLENVHWLKLFSINVISNAALYILPMRLGEIVRPTLSASQTNLKFSQTSTTSVIERTTDALIIGSLVLVSVFSRATGYDNDEIVKPFLFFSLMIVLLLAFLFVVVRRRDWLPAVMRLLMQPFPPRISKRTLQFVEQFTSATGDLITVQLVPLYIGLSLGIWLIDASSLYALFSVLDSNYPFQAALIALSMVVLGSFLPSGPGQIGVFEYSLSLGLLAYGIRLDDGIFVATIYHGIVIGTIIILGLTGLLVNRKLYRTPE